MPRQPFRFKQFSLTDFQSAMKISTDGVLLGAWTNLPDKGAVLDIGTGCGLIALMMAQRCNLKIDTIDIHEDSANEARENFENSPWKKRLTCIHQSLQEFSRQSEKKYDLIVCNPPFFSKSLLSAKEAKNLVKHDQSLSFGELVTGVKTLMVPEGIFSVIVPAHRIAEIDGLSKQSGLQCHRKTAIIPATGKSINRYMVEYKTLPTEFPDVANLVIRQSANVFTEDYKTITSPFYPQF